MLFSHNICFSPLRFSCCSLCLDTLSVLDITVADSSCVALDLDPFVGGEYPSLWHPLYALWLGYSSWRPELLMWILGSLWSKRDWYQALVSRKPPCEKQKWCDDSIHFLVLPNLGHISPVQASWKALTVSCCWLETQWKITVWREVLCGCVLVMPRESDFIWGLIFVLNWPLILLYDF